MGASEAIVSSALAGPSSGMGTGAAPPKALFSPGVLKEETGHTIEGGPGQRGQAGQGALHQGPRPRRGLNPLLMYMNSRLRAAKAAAGGSMLPHDEVQRVRQMAKERWNAMPGHVPALHIEGFQEWQSQQPEHSHGDHRPLQVYACHWGGGCRRSAITPSEFAQFINAEGWPTDEQVYHSEDKLRVEQDQHLASLMKSDFNLWGCGRRPRCLCQASLQHKDKCNSTHTSFGNWIDRLGKEQADSGTTLALIRGCKQGSVADLRVDGSGASVAAFEWFALFLSGTTYSPKVSDWVLRRFLEPDISFQAELQVPCVVRVCERACRTTGEGTQIQNFTSGELVHFLVEEKSFSKMDLPSATFEVGDDIGALAVVRILGLSSASTLWEQGSKRACISGVRKPRAGPSLRAGDPLVGVAQGKAQAKARSRPKGPGARGGGLSSDRAAPAAAASSRQEEGGDDDAELRDEFVEGLADALDLSGGGSSESLRRSTGRTPIARRKMQHASARKEMPTQARRALRKPSRRRRLRQLLLAWQSQQATPTFRRSPRRLRLRPLRRCCHRLLPRRPARGRYWSRALPKW